MNFCTLLDIAQKSNEDYLADNSIEIWEGGFRGREALNHKKKKTSWLFSPTELELTINNDQRF